MIDDRSAPANAMENPATGRPESFTLMIGPPRSGTTLIANAVMSHPDVSGVMEPYQRRRNAGGGSTEVEAFLEENAKDVSDLGRRPNLAVKETTTRTANVEMSLELMQGFASRGVYTSLIIILRCPFAAFLSQVEASSGLWAEKKMTEAEPAVFSNWIRGQRRSLNCLLQHARAQHYRMVSYEAFCAEPQAELSRLMALIPLRLDKAQMSFTPPKDMTGGGDPKTMAKSGRIEVSDRSERVARFMEETKGADEYAFALSWRRLVLERLCKEPDQMSLDRLNRLVSLGV